MSVTKLFFILVIIVGIILFLYGANYYDATVGWTGVGLSIAGVVAFIVFYVHSQLTKKPSLQKS
jgi:hypothetical protein